jgi:repressor LexA
MRKKEGRDYKDLANRMYNFFSEAGKMPSFEELKNIFNVSSKDTVFRIIKTLKDLDYILQDENGKILPIKEKLNKYLNKKEVNGNVKILGTVEAGFPTYVEVDDMESVTLDEWLLGDKHATFMLKVKGESMRDAGVLEGDYVIVERGKEAKKGDMVLALIDNGWTLKYFKKDKDGIYLEPANKNFKNIYPKENLEIKAVVVAIVRKFF